MKIFNYNHFNKINEKFYKPSKSVSDKVDEIVKDCLAKHEGGREFFDELDDRIKDVSSNPEIINALMKGKSNLDIITSGGFGDILYKL